MAQVASPRAAAFDSARPSPFQAAVLGTNLSSEPQARRAAIPTAGAAPVRVAAAAPR